MSVDSYIEGLGEPGRSVLAAIRETVRMAAPEAVEAIKYDMPVFRIGDAYLFYLGGWKRHAAIYPISRSYEFEAEIAPYRTGKDTVKFPYGQPVPHDLIARIVLARRVELGGQRSHF